VRAVNLLPRDVDRAGSDRGRLPLLVLAGGLGAITAAAILAYFSTAGTVSERRGELEAAQAAVTAATSSSEPTPNQGVVAQERTDRVAALSAALSSRVPLDVLLRQLSFVLPADAWLTGLQATSGDDASPAPASGSSGTSTPTPAGAQTSAGTSITIDGATYTQDSVARVLARLAVLPALTDIRLTKSERVVPAASAATGTGAKQKSKKKPRSVVTFSITATYGGGAS
jgi:Tfp pilus assembly protein PilN